MTAGRGEIAARAFDRATSDWMQASSVVVPRCSVRGRKMPRCRALPHRRRRRRRVALTRGRRYSPPQCLTILLPPPDTRSDTWSDTWSGAWPCRSLRGPNAGSRRAMPQPAYSTCTTARRRRRPMLPLSNGDVPEQRPNHTPVLAAAKETATLTPPWLAVVPASPLGRVR